MENYNFFDPQVAQDIIFFIWVDWNEYCVCEYCVWEQSESYD